MWRRVAVRFIISCAPLDVRVLVYSAGTILIGRKMFCKICFISYNWPDVYRGIKASRLKCKKISFRLLWPCIMNLGLRERDQQDATNLMFIIKLSQHVSGTIVCTVTFTVHTACIPAPHSHSHHYQCRTPYAAVHTIVFLMMGIMMPETCWDSWIINIRLVAYCWFLSLHPKKIVCFETRCSLAVSVSICRF